MITTFLIKHFSYTILFIWSILEGEIGLSLSGFLIRKGDFTFSNVITIAIAGAFVGDFSLFILGRVFNNRVEKYLLNYKDKLIYIKKWFKNNVVWIILFERFIYGTHIPSLLFIGMSRYSLIKFMIIDIIGITIWAIAFTSIGYYFGESVVDIIIILEHHFSIFILILITLILIFKVRR